MIRGESDLEKEKKRKKKNEWRRAKLYSLTLNSLYASLFPHFLELIQCLSMVKSH